ncbi:hypothetical protein HCN44_000711 [Aphidius gifuensis]|uniref:Uncharacterized protein n=1 Tax=Aphidius gifuensis TaxID=684658 RepID=A0A834XRI1_APHGI|nr:putative uncharacterized protein DDB_G0282499 [Aphidius gifuensis]KAF7990906.1 hypothetical protein HCN44_000711 [Aphidius gifuensis]
MGLTIISLCIFSLMIKGFEANVYYKSYQARPQAANIPVQNNWRPIIQYEASNKDLYKKNSNDYHANMEIKKEEFDTSRKYQQPQHSRHYYDYTLPSILGSFSVVGHHMPDNRNTKKNNYIREPMNIGEFNFLVPPTQNIIQIEKDPRQNIKTNFDINNKQNSQFINNKYENSFTQLQSPTDIVPTHSSFNVKKIIPRPVTISYQEEINPTFSNVKKIISHPVSINYHDETIFQPKYVEKYILPSQNTSQIKYKIQSFDQQNNYHDDRFKSTEKYIPTASEYDTTYISNISPEHKTVKKNCDEQNHTIEIPIESNNSSDWKVVYFQPNKTHEYINNSINSTEFYSPELLKTSGLDKYKSKVNDSLRQSLLNKQNKITLVPSNLNNETPESISIKHYDEQQLLNQRQLQKRNKKRKSSYQCHDGNVACNKNTTKNNTSFNNLHTRDYDAQMINNSTKMISSKLNRNTSKLTTNSAKNLTANISTPMSLISSTIFGDYEKPLSRTAEPSTDDDDNSKKISLKNFDNINNENDIVTENNNYKKDSSTQSTIEQYYENTDTTVMSQLSRDKKISQNYEKDPKLPTEDSQKLIKQSDEILTSVLPIATTPVSITENPKRLKSTMRNSYLNHQKDISKIQNATLNISSKIQTSETTLKQPIENKNKADNFKSESLEESILDDNHNLSIIQVSNAPVNYKNKSTRYTNIPALSTSTDKSIFSELNFTDNLEPIDVSEESTIMNQQSVKINGYEHSSKHDKSQDLMASLENLFNLTIDSKKNIETTTNSKVEKKDHMTLVTEKLTLTTSMPVRKNSRTRITKYNNGTRPRFSVKDYKIKINQKNLTQNNLTNLTQSIKTNDEKYKSSYKKLHDKTSTTMSSKNINPTIESTEIIPTSKMMSNFSMRRKKPLMSLNLNKNNVTLRSNNDTKLHSNNLRIKTIRPLQLQHRTFGNNTDFKKKIHHGNLTVTPNTLRPLKKIDFSKNRIKNLNIFNNKKNKKNSTENVDNLDVTVIPMMDQQSSASEIILTTQKSFDEDDISSKVSESVAQLTNSASTLYDQPGMFKALSVSRKSSIKHDTNVDVSWDTPSLPIETFFQDMADQ